MTTILKIFLLGEIKNKNTIHKTFLIHSLIHLEIRLINKSNESNPLVVVIT